MAAMAAILCFMYTCIGKTFIKIFLSETRKPWPLTFGYIASSSSHAYSTIRHNAIMLLSSSFSHTSSSSSPPPPHPPSSENIHFQQVLNIHSPMKRNHSLLEYTRDNDTQVSRLGPSGPSCFQGHYTINTQKVSLVCTLFHESIDGI